MKIRFDSVLQEVSRQMDEDDTIRVCFEDSRLIRAQLEEIEEIRHLVAEDPPCFIYFTRA